MRMELLLMRMRAVRFMMRFLMIVRGSMRFGMRGFLLEVMGFTIRSLSIISTYLYPYNLEMMNQMKWKCYGRVFPLDSWMIWEDGTPGDDEIDGRIWAEKLRKQAEIDEVDIIDYTEKL
jgi:hypothetical protein